ncbi:helix-turn-helix domain-containing protein [Nitrincola sp.]|uniref:helix-turn-helix domain-containing protein n=1 Tax=Nitrincola sp. TaxID=1926584 RepID=UPI003A8ED780
MKLQIESVEDIGTLVRFTRKAQGLRQDDLGAMAGCSHKYVVDVEKGKATIQAGLLLKLLEELGIEVTVDLPGDASDLLKNTLLSQDTSIADHRRAKWLSQIAR